MKARVYYSYDGRVNVELLDAGDNSWDLEYSFYVDDEHKISDFIIRHLIDLQGMGYSIEFLRGIIHE